MALTLVNATRSAACDAIAARLNNGTTNAGGACRLKDASVTLVTMRFSNPAFGAASNGVATMDNTPEPQANAVSAGDADVAEFLDRDDVLVMSGTVGTSGADVNLDNVNIANGQLVKLTSGTLTVPAS